jgi:hypothetical protein
MATQNAYPDGDVSVGTWSDDTTSTSNIYTAVDESGTANDSDYIVTADGGMGSTSANTVKFSLGNTVTDPGEDAGHKIIYRARLSGGDSRPLTVALYEGASLIEAAVTGTGLPALTGSFVTNTFTISNGDANGIGTYNDLQIWLTAAAADMDDEVQVSQVYFEHVPTPAIKLSGVAAKSHALGMFD